MTPAYDLAAIQRLAATPGRVGFRRSLTIRVVCERLGVAEPAARRLMRDVIGRLTPDDYAETLRAIEPPADVYGWIDGQGRGWYIKFAIDATGDLFVVSFHPPTSPLRTRAGVVRM